MDVGDVKVTDEDGFLSNSIGENLDQSRGRSVVFQPFIQTGQRDLVSAFASRHWLSMHDELNLHLYFCQQDVTDGMRSSENLLASCDYIGNSVQPVIGLCFHSSATER